MLFPHVRHPISRTFTWNTLPEHVNIAAKCTAYFHTARSTCGHISCVTIAITATWPPCFDSTTRIQDKVSTTLASPAMLCRTGAVVSSRHWWTIFSLCVRIYRHVDLHYMKIVPPCCRYVYCEFGSLGTTMLQAQTNLLFLVDNFWVKYWSEPIKWSFSILGPAAAPFWTLVQTHNWVKNCRCQVRVGPGLAWDG